MSEQSAHLLMLEFLTWVAERRRSYAEAMNAWQSHCPRHTIWEDAMIDGYIAIERREEIRDPEVILTERGAAFLNNGSHNHR
jgi:hypothetical protein